MKVKDEWADLLQAASGKNTRTPSGKGWIESKELRQKLQMGRVRFYDFLAGEMKRGTIERFEGTGVSDGGRHIRQTFYRRTSK